MLACWLHCNNNPPTLMFVRFLDLETANNNSSRMQRVTETMGWNTIWSDYFSCMWSKHCYKSSGKIWLLATWLIGSLQLSLLGFIPKCSQVENFSLSCPVFACPTLHSHLRRHHDHVTNSSWCTSQHFNFLAQRKLTIYFLCGVQSRLQQRNTIQSFAWQKHTKW